MTIFTCEDDLISMLTCIYDAWASHLGHANLRLQVEPIGNLELFCEYIPVSADEDKAQKVIRSIQRKISAQAYYLVYAAAMSTNPAKLDAIYRFLVLGFAYGASIIHRLSEDCVVTVFSLHRTVMNEAHYLKEFIRFSTMQNRVLYSTVTPKANVLDLVAPHFVDRMPSENWLILDSTRNLAAVHPMNESYYLTTLSPEEVTHLQAEITAHHDPFVGLWNAFFTTIGINERHNPRCQRNLLPLRYRPNMTEFQ